MTDTLPGVPLPALELEGPPTESDELRALERQRRVMGDLFAPVQRAWDDRASDMLAVLADSAQARAEVKSAVRTIRTCAWLGVLALLLVGASVWQVLEHDRAELRKLRELDRLERQAAVEEMGRRVNRACLR